MIHQFFSFMTHRFFFLFALLFLSIVSPAQAKTCLVLSGGGALGIAHVGVLKVLEEQNVPIDCIAGTSMGAIVGGLYASGYSAKELETLVETSEWATLFSEPNNRRDFTFQRKRDDINFLMDFKIGLNDKGGVALPKGAILGNQIDLAFLNFTLRSHGITNFDQLPIPFRAVASDVETGKPVILDHGSLVKAMRASMSVPGVFAPVEIDGKFLVDGGASNNLPIDVARSMGANHLIVVHIPTILKNYDELSSALTVAAQMISILIKQNEERQLTTLSVHDIYIRPDIDGFSSSDFAKAKEILKPGIKATQEQRTALAPLAVSPEAYAAVRARQYRPVPENPVIDFVQLNNNSKLSDEILWQKISIQKGERLSMDVLQQDLSRLYGTGHFENVTFDIVEGPENKAGVIVSAEEKTTKTGMQNTPELSDNSSSLSPEEKTELGKGLAITTRPKDWSMENFRFGLNLEDNFEGNTSYNLSARYSQTMLNDLGGELNLDGQVGENNKAKAEWYQPLTTQQGMFVAASGGYEGQNVPILENKQEIAKYRLTRYTSEGAVGTMLLDTDAEARVGIERGFGYIDLQTGDVSSAVDNNFDIGNYFVSFDYDTLDQVSFPKKGQFGNLTFREGTEVLGSTEDYQQGEGRLTLVKSLDDENTLIFTSSLQLSLQEDTPLEGQFLGGGFLSFSGYQKDQILSPNISSNRLLYIHQLYGNSEGFFNLPVYVGGSFELGDYQERRQDLLSNPIASGAGFFGTDTVFGPMYLGYGQSEGGIRSIYLFLGRSF
jgi:NTE family protein